MLILSCFIWIWKIFQYEHLGEKVSNKTGPSLLFMVWNKFRCLLGQKFYFYARGLQHTERERERESDKSKWRQLHFVCRSREQIRCIEGNAKNTSLNNLQRITLVGSRILFFTLDDLYHFTIRFYRWMKLCKNKVKNALDIINEEPFEKLVSLFTLLCGNANRECVLIFVRSRLSKASYYTDLNQYVCAFTWNASCKKWFS